MIVTKEIIIAVFVDEYIKRQIKQDTQNVIIDEIYPSPTLMDRIKMKLDNAIFDLLKYKYGHNESDEILAKRLGISVNFIKELEDDAIKKLRRDYELNLLLQNLLLQKSPKKTKKTILK